MPATAAPVTPGTATRPAGWRALLPWLGLAAAVGVVAWAFWWPGHSGQEVYPRAPRNASDREVPPLHGLWEPKWWGPGTVPAVLLALLAWRYAARVADRLPWRTLLLTSYAVGLGWLFSLALVDGSEGLTRQLGNPYEYLTTAREVTDVPTLLGTWRDRMPLYSDGAFPTHVAGHPPAALLFFVGLVRIGLGGDLAASVVVVLLAASTAPAVMVALRALDAEVTARRAAPFLALAPTAVFAAVSGDAVFAALGAWGVACLALGATRARRAPALAWSALAGLLLGTVVMMSYGLPLLGVVAVAVLLAARSWLPLPVAAVTALVVVLGFAASGWAWWEYYPVLVDRYEEGIAKDRPGGYWRWANLALLVLSAGPLVGAGVAHLLGTTREGLRRHRAPVLLAAAGMLMVTAADASGMSKAEVERIWLPFMPWLLVSCALLPERWRRWGLALQLLTALVVQHLFYTVW